MYHVTHANSCTNPWSCTYFSLTPMSLYWHGSISESLSLCICSRACEPMCASVLCVLACLYFSSLRQPPLAAVNAVSTVLQPSWASSTSAILSCVMTTSGSLIWWYPISLSPLRRKRSSLQSNKCSLLIPMEALKPRLHLQRSLSSSPQFS